MNDFTLFKAKQETLDYVLSEMEKALGEQMPPAQAVASFLEDPDGEAQLTELQQLVLMDKLLEWNEINVRVTSDLLRYQMMKQAGIVHSMDEFLERCYPDSEEE